MKIDLTSSVPLYVQLRNILWHDIAAGKYMPGGKLPTEHALMAAYRLSITTVRRALAGLVEEGAIVRKPRIGSVVLGAGKKRPTVKTLVCLKLSHLSATETVDDTIGQILADEYPGWRLRFAVMGDQSFASLSEQIESADLVIGNPGWIARLARQGYLNDLALHRDWMAEFSDSAWVPGALKAFTIGASVYALPLNFNQTMLYCQRRLFQAHGLDPLSIEWDWNTLRDLTAQLSSSTVAGLCYAPFPATLWENFVLQAGGTLVDEEARRFLPDRAAARAAFRYLQSLLTGKQAVNWRSMSHPQVFIRSQRAAMAIMGPYLHHVVDRNEEEWAVLPLPPGKTAASLAVSYGIGITRFVRDAAPVRRVLELYCGACGQSLYGRTFHVIPALRQALERDFAGADRPLVNRAVFKSSIRQAVPLPASLYDMRLQSLVVTALEEQLLKGRPAEAVLAELCPRVEAVLKENSARQPRW